MKKFAFLIHPLDMRDIIRSEPKAATKREALIEKLIEWIPPYKASHITGLKSKKGGTATGWFIAIPLMPYQFINFPREYVYKKIIQGGYIAQDLKAKILGLGGFTSVVGDAGLTISKNLNIAVTSGNSYTVSAAIQSTEKAAQLMDINLKSAKGAIVGATGSIGSVCSKILAKKLNSITLIARNLQRLKHLAESVYHYSGKKVKISTDLDLGIKDAQIIISASSAGGNIIKPQHIKPGTLICDVALPHDAGRNVAKLRPDVLVIEGGLVKPPGDTNFNYDFGYPPGICLACMAETMILALEGRFENFSLGRSIKVEKVEEITRLAKKHGFSLAGLRSFDEMVTLEKIAQVRQLAKKTRVKKTTVRP